MDISANFVSMLFECPFSEIVLPLTVTTVLELRLASLTISCQLRELNGEVIKQSYKRASILRLPKLYLQTFEKSNS